MGYRLAAPLDMILALLISTNQSIHNRGFIKLNMTVSPLFRQGEGSYREDSMSLLFVIGVQCINKSNREIWTQVSAYRRPIDDRIVYSLEIEISPLICQNRRSGPNRKFDPTAKSKRAHNIVQSKIHNEIRDGFFASCTDQYIAKRRILRTESTPSQSRNSIKI
jgi:hypothetical protein